MANRVSLTDSFIRKDFKLDKRIEFYDTVVTGMILRVTPTGHKSFALRYWYNNQAKQYTIGTFGDWSLADAREKAKELKKLVVEGKDPTAEKKKAKEPVQIYSFSDLTDRYIKRHLPELRKKTRDEYFRIINKELNPFLGDYSANEITRKQIIDLLDAVAIDRQAPVLSNRVRAVLSSVFSFGIDKAVLEVNPVLTVKKRKKGNDGEPVEKKRKRTYSPDEIKVIWEAFQVQPEPVRSIFFMLLICGQRSGETRRMKWEHLDLNENTWTIPAEETKAKREHVVPLSDMALSVLDDIQSQSDGSGEYVFESPTVKGQPVEWLQKASERVQKQSGVADFRIHDLRRTAATYMAEIGTDRTVLGKVLNHKELAGDDQVTAIYDRHTYMDEKRQALQKWANHLERMITGKETKVLKMG